MEEGEDLEAIRTLPNLGIAAAWYYPAAQFAA